MILWPYQRKICQKRILCSSGLSFAFSLNQPHIYLKIERFVRTFQLHAKNSLRPAQMLQERAPCKYSERAVSDALQPL